MERKRLAFTILLLAAITLGAGKCDDGNNSSGGSCDPVQYASSAAWAACANGEHDYTSGEINYCGGDSCAAADCYYSQDECDVLSDNGPNGALCTDCLSAMCDCFVTAGCEFVEIYSDGRYYPCAGSSDGDADGDTDGDSDVDGDSDADGDSDSDGDSDGDTAECDVGTTSCDTTSSMYQACLPEYSCCPVPDGFTGESGSVDSSGFGCLYTYRNWNIEDGGGQYCHFTIDCNNEDGCECTTDWQI